MTDINLTLKQIYDINPSTELAADTLLYGVNEPYLDGDDTAILYSDLFTQLAGSFVQTTGDVDAGDIPIYNSDGQEIKSSTVNIDENRNATNYRSVAVTQDPISELQLTTKQYVDNRPSASKRWVDPAGNNSNTGMQNAPYLDPFFASNNSTGTAASPRLIFANPGSYSTASFAIKPNVNLMTDYNADNNAISGNVWDVSTDITLDATWSSAGAGSVTYLENIKFGNTTGFDLDFSGATNGVVLNFVNCTVGLGFTDINGATAHIPTVNFFGGRVGSGGIVLTSVNSTIKNHRNDGILAIAASGGGGAGAYTVDGSIITGNVTISGSSGNVQALAITNSKLAGSITLTGTFCTLSIDADSYPAGGISYAGGATSSQVTLRTPSTSVQASGTRTNYTPTAATVEGNLAGIDNALGAISPAQNVNPNILIGTNFDLNPWQRGTIFTSTANGTYVADRFVWYQVGSGVVDITETPDAPDVALSGIFTINCLNIETTTADASIASTDKYNITTFIEGMDWVQAANQELTLSFLVKSVKTGTFCVSIQNSGLDRTFIAEYTVNATNTWEKKTISIPASPLDGTWTYTPGTVGLFVNFTIAAGSNFQDTAGSWITTSGIKLCTSNQVNGMDSTSNIFEINLIKLERGSVATTFPVEDPVVVLQQCQRYFETSVSTEAGFYFPTTNQTGAVNVQMPVAGTSGFSWYIPHRVRKAVTPTIAVCDNAGTVGSVFKGAAGKAATISSIGNGGFAGGTSDATNASTLYFHYTSTGELA